MAKWYLLRLCVSVERDVVRERDALIGVNAQGFYTEMGDLGKTPDGNKVSHRSSSKSPSLL
ncbi:hypothetical protein KSC_033040 [Ktedonobacter sp. SOSP1-52]|nr:hypothetical protein KSC_033040 [Ktedonobacter sp. SOSP1-52]